MISIYYFTQKNINLKRNLFIRMNGEIKFDTEIDKCYKFTENYN